MAKLSAHGTEIGRINKIMSQIVFMSDGHVLRNNGSGWKKWRKVKKEFTPTQAFQDVYKNEKELMAKYPNHTAYCNELHETFALEFWRWAHELIKENPDPVVLWDKCEKNLQLRRKPSMVHLTELCRLYNVALPEFTIIRAKNAEKRGPTLPPKVTMDMILKAIEADDHLGFCLACGAEAQPVEPDARQYRCETCGENKVYGAEELLIMFGA